MHEPLYRQALDKSWHLLWEHKKFWILGVFAAFWGQMGLLDLFTKVGFSASTLSSFPVLSSGSALLSAVKDGGLGITSLDAQIWLAGLLILFLGLALLGILVSVASHGALIRVAADYAKRGSLPSLSRAWRSGIKYFWPLFFLQAVKKIIIGLLAAAVAFAALNAILAPGAWSFILFLLLFVLAAAVGMVISFLVVYAAGYLVVEDYSWGRAAAGAWNLFVSHWLVSLEVGLIVLVLNVAAGLLALLGFFAFFLPTLVAWFIAVLTVNSSLWWAGLFSGILFTSIFVIFLGALLTVYTTSVWTYLFMKMHREGVVSRVIHWLKK